MTADSVESEQPDARWGKHPAGVEIEFSLDGLPVRAPSGLSVAAALLHLGRRCLGETARLSAPRAVFCGMGICFDCTVEIDGRGGVRSCCMLLQPGMQIVTRRREAALAPLA